MKVLKDGRGEEKGGRRCCGGKNEVNLSRTSPAMALKESKIPTEQCSLGIEPGA